MDPRFSYITNRMTKTRLCTEIYRGHPGLGQLLEFSRRTIPVVDSFNQKIFHSEDLYPDEVVLEALEKTLEEAVLEKQGILGKRKISETKIQPTWKEKVNRKREYIKQCLQNQTHLNLKQVARATKSGYDTVKRLYRQLSMRGYLIPYEYNNLKSVEQMESLHKTIDHVDEGFKTVTDLKREYPTFSRRFILKELHNHGYRWHMLPRERKHPVANPPSSTRICRVISHLSQCLLDPQVEILYVDEVKFPLFQTSTHSWTKDDPQNRIVYNRRPVPDKLLTVIALCSTTQFLAVQVFDQEVTGKDFLYFLNGVISQLPTNKKYSILLDNAGWHHANLVERSKANKFLFFNEARMFQLNIIENAFSFVRSVFRKRPTVETTEEEARQIIEIFFDPMNIRKFKGLFRNHLRQLIKYLQKHRAN